MGCEAADFIPIDEIPEQIPNDCTTVVVGGLMCIPTSCII